MMGWESEDFLQNAVDTCTNASGEISDCALFNIQSDDTAAQCTFEAPDSLADDDVSGPRDGLPISVPIQSGPSYATTYPVVMADGSIQGGGSATSQASSTSSAASSSSAVLSAVVPTLTYSAATASITDKYGGGILIANTASSYEPSSTSGASSSTVTVAASAADASGDGANIVATSMMTKGNQVIEMYIQEVDVTVTAAVTATETAHPNARRHLQEHQHRRVRHNGRH